MPGPGPHRFSEKEDRMAEHIADSERKLGKSPEEARSIGYATMQKRRGRGIKKIGSRTGRPRINRGRSRGGYR